MTMPMAVFALIAWLKNPYNENKAEVKVNRISQIESVRMWGLTGVVTVVFYFIIWERKTHYPWVVGYKRPFCVIFY